MALTTLIVGLLIIGGGVYILLNPRIQGARDVGLITSESANSAEQYTAYIGGIILIVIGLAFVYLSLL